jgi:hypothetical protein
MKNAVFWDMTPYGSYNVRRFGGTYRLLHQGWKNFNVLPSLVTANVVLSSPILITLMMEGILPSETSVLTTAAQRHIPEDGSFHSHRSENFKPYIYIYPRLSSGIS